MFRWFTLFLLLATPCQAQTRLYWTWSSEVEITSATSAAVHVVAVCQREQ